MSEALGDIWPLAFEVSTALTAGGIPAVLTGGAAAMYWSGGAYQSYDLDFVVTMWLKDGSEGRVMEAIGFERFRRYWRRAGSEFFVEFPPGPLMVGQDDVESWATERRGDQTLQILTPTDSVRDRLCAFYFWRDISALLPAIEIALRQDVDLGLIADWSRREGESERFDEFSRRLRARQERP